MLSEFRTAAPCGTNSKTLTTSNEESLNTKVVDLFELYNFGIELALIGLHMRKLWSKYQGLQNGQNRNPRRTRVQLPLQARYAMCKLEPAMRHVYTWK